MARGFQLACLLLIQFGLLQQASAQASLFLNAKTAVETAIIVRDNVNYVKQLVTGENIPSDGIKDKDVWMLNKLNEIDNNIITFKEQLFQKASWNIASKLDLKIHDFADRLDKVNILYGLFMEIVENLEKYNNRTVDRFAKTVTSSSLVELTSTVEQLHTSLYTPNFEGSTILSIISGDIEHSQMCGKNQSPQQMINELYKSVVNADLKSIAIKTFAYGVNQVTDNTSYEFEINKEYENYQERTQKTYEKVAQAMRNASRDIWRCDPMSNIRGKQLPNHQRDQTYSTLQEVFQSVLVFERDIKPSCYDQCGDYKYASNMCNSQFCKHQKKPCSANNGVVRDCMDMGDYADVCYAPQNSERQYDWSKTDSDLTYGRDRNSCRSKMVKLDWEYPTWADAGRKIAPAFRHCNYCLCTCELLDSDISRYFSLHESKSDKYLNKVITGVRFKKIGYVFHIQIQQGTLVANGTVESASWQKVPYRYSNKQVMLLDPFAADYPLYRVTWKTRTVYLDEIVNKTPAKKVLTGLRFKRVDSDMRLEAELTDFDYATGKLGNSQWHFSPAGRNKRTVIHLDNADDPVRHINDAVYSNPGSYVQFQRSSMTKDMGQLTIPFLETQAVESDPPVPIAGISLFLKAAEGSGGFLAFKLTQYDLSPHL